MAMRFCAEEVERDAEKSGRESEAGITIISTGGIRIRQTGLIRYTLYAAATATVKSPYAIPS